MTNEIIILGNHIDMQLLYKIIYTAISLSIVVLVTQIAIRQAKRVQQQKKMKRSRYFLLKKVVRVLSLFVLAVLLILIWGIDVKNLWVSLTSILALVAIGFLAVWSLIGNILAGIIIFFTSPFKINDVIEIIPDEVSGKVIAINTFYTLLIDEEENYINIPHSLFFQKYIKVKKKGTHPVEKQP